MLTTIGEIKGEFLVRMQGNTTVAFYTDDMLSDWLNIAHRTASGYKKWPFTEGRISTTFATGAGENTDEWNFEGFKPDSIRILMIDGKRFDKLNFEDYQIMREETPEANDRVFSDFSGIVFVNPNADVSGTMTAYGQYVPAAIDITDENALTIFSNKEDDGNEAMVELMMYFAKLREKKTNEAQSHQQKGFFLLEMIWKRYLDEQYNYKTHRTRGGMFKRFDVVEGDISDQLFRRDQF